MTDPTLRTAVPLVVVLVAAAVGGAVVPAVPSPVAAVTGQVDDGPDRTAGGLVGSLVADQRASLGTPVSAGSGSFDRAFYGRVAAFAAAYDDDPPALGLGGRLATGSVVNLRVGDGDDVAVVSFRLSGDNRIEDLRAGARGDAKIRMAMDRATFDRLATAESPSAAFRRALDTGEVRITGRGLGSSVVWAVVNRLRGL